MKRFLIVLVLALSACGVDTESLSVPTLIDFPTETATLPMTNTSAPTETSIPSDTPTLTSIPTNTETIMPSDTPARTNSPEPTETATVTDTPTNEDVVRALFRPIELSRLVINDQTRYVMMRYEGEATDAFLRLALQTSCEIAQQMPGYTHAHAITNNLDSRIRLIEFEADAIEQFDDCNLVLVLTGDEIRGLASAYE